MPRLLAHASPSVKSNNDTPHKTPLPYSSPSRIPESMSRLSDQGYLHNTRPSMGGQLTSPNSGWSANRLRSPQTRTEADQQVCTICSTTSGLSCVGTVGGENKKAVVSCSIEFGIASEVWQQPELQLPTHTSLTVQASPETNRPACGLTVCWGVAWRSPLD
jgi:hypothetical protein